MIPSDIKDLPFTPSPYCTGTEHRRVEKCKDLIGNKEFRAIGICQHRGCKGKKWYPHDDLFRYGSINIPSERRDFILFRDKPERITHMNRHLVGGV